MFSQCTYFGWTRHLMTEVMHPRNVSCLEGTAQRVGEDGADAEPRSPGPRGWLVLPSVERAPRVPRPRPQQLLHNTSAPKAERPWRPQTPPHLHTCYSPPHAPSKNTP